MKTLRATGLIAPCIFLAIAAAICSGCAPSLPAGNPITGKWYYALGRERDTAAEAASYVYRPLDSLANLEKRVPRGRGILWLRTDFSPNRSLLGRRLSYLGGIVNPTDITYINGQEIGRSGIARSDQFFSEWNTYRKYDVPASILHGGINTLHIRMFVDHEGSLGGRFALGPQEEISQIYAFENFFRTDLNALIAAVIFIIGVYHLILFVYRPGDRSNLYYSLICIFFSLYQTNFFITRTPLNAHHFISYIAYQKVVFSCMFITCGCFVLFINSFLKVRVPRWVEIITTAYALLGVLVLMAAPEYRYVARYHRLLIASMVLPVSVYVTAVITYSAIRKNRTARTVLMGAAPLVACVIFDVVTHNIMTGLDFIYLSGIGFSAFLISIMFFLANDFVTYHNEIEELNVTLDRKVEERTEELQKAKEAAEKTTAELKKAHGDLKSLNQELATAHNAMKRDMSMAASVQLALYPKRAPESAQWDTAFLFRPMSGVSGDLYDFFLADGRLYGAALFDVSGHGISSGLITMIVKSVLLRNFTGYRDLQLNQLMYRINGELVREMGEVDNYITGVLLRFADQRVEYVNAGHADLMMKSGTTGEARIVAPREGSARGQFLGIDAMNDAFPMVRFQIRRGDSILLYSDGLVEGADAAGEQYGAERLQAFYSGLDPALTAEEQIDAIAADLYRHTGTDALRDDLTIILFKKTE